MMAEGVSTDSGSKTNLSALAEVEKVCRTEKQVYVDNLQECLSIFRNNRNLPGLPSRSDMAGKWDSYVSLLYTDIIKRSKRGGLTMNEQEFEAAKKSHAAAAISRAFASTCVADSAKGADGGGVLAKAEVQEGVSEVERQKDALASSLKTTASDELAHLVFPKTMKRPEPIWPANWRLKTVICGHSGWVRCLDVDPTNEWFASAGNDRLIKIWDLASGTLKLSLTGHIHAIRDIQISARHPYLFSCAEDNTVKCWDLEQNKVVRHYHGHLSGVYSLTLHPTIDVLASGGRDASVRLWDLRTRDAIHVLSGHSSTVLSLASQDIEPQLISGSADCTIRAWDLRKGKVHTVLTHHSKSIRSLAIHPRQYSFVSAGGDAVKIWNGSEAVYERDLDVCKSILNSVAIKDHPDSTLVVAGADNGFLFFWDYRSGKCIQTLESTPQPGSLSSENGIHAVKFDKSETRLITGECDKTIKIWHEVSSYEEDDDMDERGSAPAGPKFLTAT